MNFWSKGLGEKTIDLHLGKGEAHPGADQLYVKGQTEAPVSWEYIVALRGEDFVDFFALLRDPAMADFIYDSPDRWRLLGGMIAGGIRAGGRIAFAALRNASGTGATTELVELELPPRSVAKKKRGQGRRLGSRRLASATEIATDTTPAMTGQKPQTGREEAKKS